MEEYTVYNKGRGRGAVAVLFVITSIVAAIIATVVYGLLGVISFALSSSLISYGSLFLGIWVCLMVLGALATQFDPIFAVMNAEGIFFPFPECTIPWQALRIHKGNQPPCCPEDNDLFLEVASPFYGELLEDGLTEDSIFCCDVDEEDLPHRKFIRFNSTYLEQPIAQIRKVIEGYKSKS